MSVAARAAPLWRRRKDNLARIRKDTIIAARTTDADAPASPTKLAVAARAVTETRSLFRVIRETEK